MPLVFKALTVAPVVQPTNVIFFQEDYTVVPTGNVALTSVWTGKGYTELENSGAPANVQILARASMPSGLLSNPNFPAGKTRICLFNLAANEIQARLLWAGLASAQSTLSVSWWEYRALSQVGGEKFCRVGNFVSGPGSNRGIDSIWTLGQVSGLTLIANSLNMHAYGDHSFGSVITGWPPGLNHFEAVYTVSTGLSANGSVSFFQNGSQVANATGLQFYDTLGQAATALQLWDTGGWSSTGGGTEGPVTYPIVRYWCACRVANQRQGVWPLSAV